MTDRFLGVGINAYPNAPLRGCVSDIQECCEMLTAGWGHDFPYRIRDLRSCTNARAHAKGIYWRMLRTVGEATPGDRILIWLSGHGAQVPIRSDDTQEVDGLTEVLCPVDFDFDDPSTWITDADFLAVFSNIPAGVNCVVVIDMCHSGGMVDPSIARMAIESELSGKEAFISPWPTSHNLSRSYPMSHCFDYQVRLDAAREKGIVPYPLVRQNSCPNVAFVLGCEEDQTCSDAWFPQSGYRGALSKCLWDAIRNSCKEPLRDVIAETTRNLEAQFFIQKPYIVGPEHILEAPFMARL